MTDTRNETGDEPEVPAVAPLEADQQIEAAEAPPTGMAAAAQGLLRIAERVQSLWTLGVLILLIIVFGIIASDFFSQANWIATTDYAMDLLLLAAGQTFVIITGGIDLSDGAILGLAGMGSAGIMAKMIGAHDSGLLVFIIGWVATIVIGAFAGWVNGALITRLKLAPFIVTLGMLSVATGVTEVIENGNDVVTFPKQMGALGSGVIGGWVPTPVLIAAVLTAVFGVLLAKTRFGRRTYAIGSNVEAARRAGINVNRHLIYVYTISGALAGIAGFLVTARYVDASPTSGADAELDAIAAVVIGGASLLGGSGSVGKSVIGAFVISVLITGLVLANVTPFWQPVAVGCMVVIAVFIDQLRRRVLQRA
jgi:ribose transport system permease protein